MSTGAPNGYGSCQWVRELLMGFQDAAFLPSRASFFNTFFTKCGRGESLGTTTCLKTEVGGMQWHAPCKIHSLQQSLILCQLNFIG